MVKTHPQGDYRYQDPENEAETQSELHFHADGGPDATREPRWEGDTENGEIVTLAGTPRRRSPARRGRKKGPALRGPRDRPKRGNHYMWTESERAHAVW